MTDNFEVDKPQGPVKTKPKGKKAALSEESSLAKPNDLSPPGLVSMEAPEKSRERLVERRVKSEADSGERVERAHREVRSERNSDRPQERSQESRQERSQESRGESRQENRSEHRSDRNQDRGQRHDRAQNRGSDRGQKHSHSNQRSDRQDRHDQEGRRDRSERNDHRDREDSSEPAAYTGEKLPRPEGIQWISNLADLQRMDMKALIHYAHALGIQDTAQFRSTALLVFEIVKCKLEKYQEPIQASGVLEILPDGYGFLRSPEYSYTPSPEDLYVSKSQIKKYALRKGDYVEGPIRTPKNDSTFCALVDVESINKEDPNLYRDRIFFENLVAEFPTERLLMETSREKLTTRLVDISAPVGKGQRGLIVAPPKAGKTTLMQDMANSILRNNPECHVIMLLIDERPEEVTEMKRNVRTEVFASTFDEVPTRHIQVAEMVIERAKRLVEGGKDVAIFLDSLTRLARAYNTVQPSSGKILSGGIDASCLYKPKRFFGAARNIEGGGSLTILATALIDTGSKMDEVIFEEFKGTGNMEIQLSRVLAEKRMYPAIDIFKSSTRMEEKLFHKEELFRVHSLLGALSDDAIVNTMNLIHTRLKNTQNNLEFLMSFDLPTRSKSS